jgi:predicted component of type VI protein secretion system
LKNELGDEMRLEFEISAQLQLQDGRRAALRFATSVDGSGNVKVQ